MPFATRCSYFKNSCLSLRCLHAVVSVGCDVMLCVVAGVSGDVFVVAPVCSVEVVRRKAKTLTKLSTGTLDSQLRFSLPQFTHKTPFFYSYPLHDSSRRFCDTQYNV